MRISDWSSDVCSSDRWICRLPYGRRSGRCRRRRTRRSPRPGARGTDRSPPARDGAVSRAGLRDRAGVDDVTDEGTLRVAGTLPCTHVREERLEQLDILPGRTHTTGVVPTARPGSPLGAVHARGPDTHTAPPAPHGGRP